MRVNWHTKGVCQIHRSIVSANGAEFIADNKDDNFKATFAINVLVYQEVCRTFVKYYDKLVSEGIGLKNRPHYKSKTQNFDHLELNFNEYTEVVFNNSGTNGLGYSKKACIVRFFLGRVLFGRQCHKQRISTCRKASEIRSSSIDQCSKGI